MFCTSLRKRQEFAPVIPSLLSSQTPKWLEKNLNTFDIALPLPRGNNKPDFFRLLLLSESDTEPLSRIERLCAITGGRNIGVVFLLKEKFTNGNGMIAYMNLQASIFSSNFEVSLIPLSSLFSLQKTFTSFQQQLLQTHLLAQPVKPEIALLPYCSSGRLLEEHTVFVLSDKCRCLRDLAEYTSTEEGKMYLGEFVEGRQLEAVVQFWDVETIRDS